MTSPEEENFLRIVYLHYRVVTPVLKRFFDGKHPNLSADLNLATNKAILSNLHNPPPRGRRILFAQQWNTLYPPTGSPSVVSTDLDLTLMVCLLRNIPPVVVAPVPSGFDQLPLPSDISDGANIARIKYYKNFLVSHSTDGKIVSNDFSNIWTELETAITGLGNAHDVADANLAKSITLDNTMKKLLLTQLELKTKVSDLQVQMEIEQCAKVIIQTQIKSIEEQIIINELKTSQQTEENKSNTSSRLREMQELNHQELTRNNISIANLEEHQTSLRNFQVVILDTFDKLDMVVSKNKTDIENLKGQVESTCIEIKSYNSNFKKRIDLLAEKSGNVEKLLEDAKCYGTKQDIGQLRVEFEELKLDRKKVPEISSDWMIKKLIQWKQDEVCFVETRAMKHVMDCIREKQCVSIIGSSGVGKTFLVQHVALEMEQIGYTIISVNVPNDIRVNYKLNRKTLFVVDDLCGNFTANTERLDEWKRSMTDITDILDNDLCKLILTCRIQVFQDEGFKHSKLQVFQTCVCNLGDTKLSLTQPEKEKLSQMYFTDTHRSKLKHLYQYDFFPLLCELYNKSKDLTNFCLDKFLKDPFAWYETELNDLFVDCKESKFKFSALLLLVVCNNYLEKKLLANKDDRIKTILEDILEECDIEQLRCKKLISVLGTLTGTFVSIEKDFYHTIHDKLFDFLAYYFGTKNEVTSTEFTRLLIKHAENDFLRERFVIRDPGESDDTKNEEYVITLQDDNIAFYIERVFSDLTKSDSIDNYLNGNRNRQNESFQKKLSVFINQLQKDKISTLIQNASSDFLCRMFVMHASGNKSFCKDLEYENVYYGIILDKGHIEKYIERIFDDMTKSYSVKCYMKRCRCCRYEAFRIALLTYISKLSSPKIADLIKNASLCFVQKLFVMSEDDIYPSSQFFYQRYGIQISGDHIQFYIERVFNEMISCSKVPNYIESFRCSGKKDFDTAMQSFMDQLSSSSITEIIKKASKSFVQNMFVMRGYDIKPTSRECYRRYGVKLTDDIKQVYIERVFDDMTKSDDVNGDIIWNRNRRTTNFHTQLRDYMKKLDRSMIEILIKKSDRDFIYQLCVMTKDGINERSNRESERYGIIIYDECTQLYVDRWFDEMSKSKEIWTYFQRNRNRHTNKFKTTLLTYMAELQEEKIEKLIQTGSYDFLHKMFVSTETDIRKNSTNEYEHYGIVLHQKYLNMYTKIIFGSRGFKENCKYNRTIKSVINCMNQLDMSQITAIIQTSDQDVFHQMITVDMENDLRLHQIYSNCQSPESIVQNMWEIKEEHITCPISFIRMYMDRMISDWVKGKIYTVFKNKNLKNPSFVNMFVDHLKLLETSTQLCILHITTSPNVLNDSAVGVICRQGVVKLANWCLEIYLHEQQEKEHNILWALFLLVVFNNQLEQSCLTDELLKITDVKFSFRKMLNIRNDISARQIIEELNTSLNIFGLYTIEGVYSVNDEMFSFLVYYFASTRRMSKILVENADAKVLYKWFLVEKSVSGQQ